MSLSCALPATHPKATFDRIYSELALHQAVIRAYSKPLFTWRKALGRSHDGRTLYDFAADSLQNTAQLHRQLARGEFVYRPGIELHFNGARMSKFWKHIEIRIGRVYHAPRHDAFTSV